MHFPVQNCLKAEIWHKGDDLALPTDPTSKINQHERMINMAKDSKWNGAKFLILIFAFRINPRCMFIRDVEKG